MINQHQGLVSIYKFLLDRILHRESQHTGFQFFNPMDLLFLDLRNLIRSILRALGMQLNVHKKPYHARHATPPARHQAQQCARLVYIFLARPGRRDLHLAPRNAQPHILHVLVSTRLSSQPSGCAYLIRSKNSNLSCVRIHDLKF